VQDQPAVTTFLFTDIEGSTRLWEHHPQAMQVALARHNLLVQRAIDTHGGVVFATAGDSFDVAFNSPVEAVRAALDAQRAAVGDRRLGQFQVRHLHDRISAARGHLVGDVNEVGVRFRPAAAVGDQEECFHRSFRARRAVLQQSQDSERSREPGWAA
jgi:class 3 adenylate cyclase